MSQNIITDENIGTLNINTYLNSKQDITWVGNSAKDTSLATCWHDLGLPWNSESSQRTRRKFNVSIRILKSRGNQETSS